MTRHQIHEKYFKVVRIPKQATQGQINKYVAAIYYEREMEIGIKYHRSPDEETTNLK